MWGEIWSLKNKYSLAIFKRFHFSMIPVSIVGSIWFGLLRDGGGRVVILKRRHLLEKGFKLDLWSTHIYRSVFYLKIQSRVG